MKQMVREWVGQCIYRMQECNGKVNSCLDVIEEAETWCRPKEHINSIGNLVLHLCGNIRQYAIASAGNQPDTRERDKEFSTTGGFTKSELKNKLSSTVEEAVHVVRNIDEHELLRVRSVQGFSMTGIGIVIHVTEHFSYHTGQIILLTKLFRDWDPGFYSGIDLNKRNE